jgi:hypothetical protein
MLNGAEDSGSSHGADPELLREFISDMMPEERVEALLNFYSSITGSYPSATFQHEVVNVGTIGAAFYAEVHVSADFPGASSNLPPASQAIKRGNYLLIFQAVPAETGWKFLDWEDAWFPESVLSYSIQEPLQ